MMYPVVCKPGCSDSRMLNQTARQLNSLGDVERGRVSSSCGDNSSNSKVSEGGLKPNRDKNPDLGHGVFPRGRQEPKKFLPTKTINRLTQVAFLVKEMKKEGGQKEGKGIDLSRYSSLKCCL